MPDDQHTRRVHHQGLCPAKLADTLGHIGDLRRVMPFCIGGVGRYGIQPPHFDLHKALLPVLDLGTVTLQLCGTGQSPPAQEEETGEQSGAAAPQNRRFV